MKQERFVRGLFLAVVLTGMWCTKKFDAPPAISAETVLPNFTIRALRLMHTNGNFEHITQDLVIGGIVVADDRSGNFYKSIVVQDSTAGITIRLDGTGLYNDYPVGEKICIRLNGLWMGDYARMIQLGAGIDNSDPGSLQLLPLPSPLFGRFLVDCGKGAMPAPIPVTIDRLTDSFQSCLVQLSSVEFGVSDTGRTYADVANKTSSNISLKACAGGSVYLRTSGYADFAGVKVPRGNGSVTAVYSVFGTEKQLMIRDTADISMEGLRCTASGYKTLFSEDFEPAGAVAPVSGPGWKNIAETGSVYFLKKQTSGNSYAEVTAFATGQPAVTTWLILPPVNLSYSGNEILHFDTRDGYDDGAQLQVLVSTNYDGSMTPSKARWTPLKAAISRGSVSSLHAGWVHSGNISLASYNGNVYIAFRYDAGDTANQNDRRTTTFQVDNIRIEGN